MAAHKRTRITIQTDQILLIRKRGCARRWCELCGREVDVLELSQAEALIGLGEARVGESLEQEAWHALQGPSGTTLVCLDSLLKSK